MEPTLVVSIGLAVACVCRGAFYWAEGRSNANVLL